MVEADDVELQGRRVQSSIEAMIGGLECALLDLEEQHIDACALSLRANTLRERAYEAKAAATTALDSLRRLAGTSPPPPSRGFAEPIAGS